MDQIFRIGDFTFRMRYPKEVSPASELPSVYPNETFGFHTRRGSI